MRFERREKGERKSTGKKGKEKIQYEVCDERKMEERESTGKKGKEKYTR